MSNKYTVLKLVCDLEIAKNKHFSNLKNVRNEICVFIDLKLESLF